MSRLLAEPTRHVVDTRAPLLTLFTVLKPFVGEADVHQRNAIASWRALSPDVEVILISDSSIPADIRAECNCYRATKMNRYGTPLLDGVFRLAAEQGRGSMRAFVNADIILDGRFVRAAEQLLESGLKSWLAIGQRTELDVPEIVDHTTDEWIAECFRRLDCDGTHASIVCKDYFIFPADLFRDVPAFAIGRGNWDSWMVWQSKASQIPVVDISEVAPVIHQKHGYNHVSGGRFSAYVSGPEARENQRLAGGRNLLSGSTADWKMDANGIHRLPFATFRIGKDVFRFASLLRSMVRLPVS
ncbi:hypothetical protein [Aporhodopirellula aestuarii]|uniref:Glycosyltransferase n=1 Tax=Aporhodopirellula aestuarii TaxID=2950107 RepID=A0ABT0U0T5_9BACT|nr:hypothetical protein [Aporhodopirellula aestuarii]MCM2370254.1 hypothetical protein [Aporhodopirellula aestuarii]